MLVFGHLALDLDARCLIKLDNEAHSVPTDVHSSLDCHSPVVSENTFPHSQELRLS